MNNYSFPIDPDWSTEEIVQVVNFLAAVEQAHQEGIAREELASLYREFKTVVTSISGEKQLDKAYKKQSGYSIYAVTKQLKQSESAKIQVSNTRK